MEPFSVVANIAQVISLADTIWRIGRDTYRIILAVKNVPQEISQLGLELQEIESLLWNIRIYCERYQQQHPSTSLQENSPIVRIYLTLQNLQTEYHEISKIVNEDSAARQLSKRYHWKRWGGKFKLVLGGRLTSSSKNLTKYKSQLSMNLQVLSSLNELAVNDRLESIHNTVSNINTPGPILSTDHTLGRKCQSLRSIDSMMQQLKAMRCSVEEGSTDYEQHLDCWIGDPQHIQRAALPLSLLRGKIEEALSLLMDSQPGHPSLSTKDAGWIQSNLEDLLATSYEKAAIAIRNPPSVPRKELPSSLEGHHNRDTSFSPSRIIKDRDPQSVVSAQFLHQDATAGKVTIRVQWSRESTGQPYASEVLLMLAPKQGLAEHGILISLSKYYEKLQSPRITRQVSSYVVVEPDSPAFSCVRSNDIHGLRDLLQNTEATPTMRSTDNESLLSYAARNLRLEICELLLNEGADPNNCRWDGANAIYDVRNAFWYRPSGYSIPKSTLNRILRLFVSAGCDINAVALGGSPLHFTVGHASPGTNMINEAEIQALVDLLVCLGCDIEHRNANGLTPLLFNAIVPRWHGTTILRALLQWGANPHATTNFGEGALHLAIAFSGPGSLHSHAGATSLESRLVLLLQEGCDPSLRDVYGHTPSDFAMGSPKVWFQWCMAIEKTGTLDMESILDYEEGLVSGGSGSDDPAIGGAPGTERSGLDTCSDASHIFLSWNESFPWSTGPFCHDCGLPCDLGYIPWRKRSAWAVFRELEAHFKGI
ncbi:ankyrin repeat-containing domain protein [Aspergillus ambiguus]|uniref:ankyrin repeat domain-containing protein n=1 Tax=Aspergillus ambiguus TaxID=176160 RepID=UPI003CCCC4A4